MLKRIFRVLFGRRSTRRPKKQTNNQVPIDLALDSATEPCGSSATNPWTAALATPSPPLATTLAGTCYVIDGDTIQIGKVRLRLAGIDAPELDHPWGKKAKWELVQICKGQIVTAEIEPDISYDRLVATCYLSDGRDLSAEMVKRGLALDWPKYSGGKYSSLEPQGVRKKHWKAAARQRGHMHVFKK